MTDSLESLTAIALDAVERALCTGERRLPDVAALPPGLARRGAAFVTLERAGALLGCIGTLTPESPLGITVADSALGAAFDDPRLPPIDADDFRAMSVKVSVLSELRPLEVSSREQLVAALRPGRDGVVIEQGHRRATFLPSVWESLTDTEQFLDALWAKAGLRRRVWDAHLRVFTYHTVEVSDPGPRRRPEPGARGG